MKTLRLYLDKYDEATRKACYGKPLREIPKQVYDEFMRLRDEWKPSEPTDTGTRVCFQWRTRDGFPMEFEAQRHIERSRFMRTKTDYHNNLGGHNYWTITLQKAVKAEFQKIQSMCSLCWVAVSENKIQIGGGNNHYYIPQRVRTKKEVCNIAETIKRIYNLI